VLDQRLGSSSLLQNQPKTKEVASEFPKGAKKSTFWIPVKEPPLYITANQHPPAHHEGWMVSGAETVFCWIPVPLTNHGG